MENENQPLENASTPAEPVIDPLKGAKDLYALIHDFAYVLAFVAVMFIFVLRLVTVDGNSMKQTLFHGDYVALESSFLCGGEYEQGDIVVAVPPNFADGKSPIVKRVIATAGQTVYIDFAKGTVEVDGVVLEENYVNSLTTLYEGVNFPVTVPEGCVFLMGDNRNDSRDSRDPDIGMVDTRYILGKVVSLVLPADSGNGRDYGRIGWID